MEFDLSFTHGLLLPANHYFFVPQVEVSDARQFLLAVGGKADRGPGRRPRFTDLQSWTRDEMLDPDWLRVGTDITGTRVRIQRVVLAQRHGGSRAFDLGHDAARLRRPWLRRLSQESIG